MQLKDLTEEQADKICDYIEEHYAIKNERGYITNFGKWCKECPFSIYIGELNYYDCAQGIMFRDLPEEFEEVIKND